MYTDCPDCKRQFRLRADHLTGAGGLVICGFCGRKFNALERLHDRPQKRPPAIHEPEVPPAQVETRTAPVFLDKAGRGAGVSGIKKPIKESTLDLPAALLDAESVAGTARTQAAVWGTGVLLLLLLFAAQYAWFNRDEVLQAYPRFVPWVEKICARLPCNVLRLRDASAIQILNRDVRLHPAYADTLLVNATMVNRSDSVQSFPRIQLTLFDTSGKALASRNFTAAEYLDGSIEVSKGMAPEQPVHFVLEVTGPTRDAVSFEFRFL